MTKKFTGLSRCLIRELRAQKLKLLGETQSRILELEKHLLQLGSQEANLTISLEELNELLNSKGSNGDFN